MRTLGKYQIVKAIGRGGMGEVYLARERGGGRRVALKLVHRPEDPERAAVYAQLFDNETRLVGLLDHPGIVRLYEAGREGDIYFVAMEYIGGAQTLEIYCRPQSLLPPARVMSVVGACAEALAHAHERGVVHRDIKPANLLLGASGEIKISDFGIAVLATSDVLDTQPLLVLGSPLYMSPEQIREEPLTGQSDVFALGVVLYELLTGSHPFAARTLAAVTHKVLEEPVAAIAHGRAGISDRLRAIVARSLAKSRAARYPSAAELAADLRSEGEQPGAPVAGSRRIEALRALACFTRFSEPELWDLLHWAEWREYQTGEELIRAGESGERMYIVIDGEVEVRHEGAARARLGAGDSLGEVACLEPGRYRDDAYARGPVTALALPGADLVHASEPCRVKLQQLLIRRLVERLGRT